MAAGDRDFEDFASLLRNGLGRLERQLGKLLDLYISDGFPKEMLQERKSCLQATLAKLQHEQADISGHLHTTVISDEQVEDIEAFVPKCVEV